MPPSSYSRAELLRRVGRLEQVAGARLVTLGDGTERGGIEPSTNRPAGRIDARERGELIELRAGESRLYELELGALDGEGQVEQFAARVAVLTGARKASRREDEGRRQV